MDIGIITIFILAVFVGFEIITKVRSLIFHKRLFPTISMYEN